ncbi:helix-turn-helix domain-containing protein [Peribacillus sp. NPDC097206]|uniref:helix-turn-helix domain-containing protein n=1 Tax=unclassified Peribacillus TaxID=2675266 RepID=UPI0038223BA6
MIGKNIAEIRKKRGYTLSELAKKSKISKSYLSNIERNINKNPSLEVMKKIATVLKVDLISLLKNGLEGEKSLLIEKEWIGFFNELKELGVEKNQLHEYKTLIEFIKWKNESSKRK